MSNSSSRTGPAIRKLRKYDLPAIIQHLLRLDPENRRLRFGAAVDDHFIKTYAERILDIGSVIVGAFPDGQLRAVGELRGLRRYWLADGELALSVERGWQRQGIGSALFSRLETVAQNRGVKSLHVLFLSENRPMRRIVARHRPVFEVHSSQVDATFDPALPTPLSIACEIVEDTFAHIRHVRTLFMPAAPGSPRRT